MSILHAQLCQVLAISRSLTVTVFLLQSILDTQLEPSLDEDTSLDFFKKKDTSFCIIGTSYFQHTNLAANTKNINRLNKLIPFHLSNQN